MKKNYSTTTINRAINTITFEVVDTRRSRNQLRRVIINYFHDSKPRDWKYYSIEAPIDYFTTPRRH